MTINTGYLVPTCFQIVVAAWMQIVLASPSGEKKVEEKVEKRSGEKKWRKESEGKNVEKSEENEGKNGEKQQKTRMQG